MVGLLFLLYAFGSQAAINYKCSGTESLETLNSIPSYTRSPSPFLPKEQANNVKQLQIDPDLISKWHYPINEVKSISVLFHGLNFRNDYMRDVIDILNRNNSLVLNVSLPGFREKLDTKTNDLISDTYIYMPRYYTPYGGSNVKLIDKLAHHPERNPSLHTMFKQIMAAYCIGNETAQHLNVDLNIVGYSMSGLFTTALLNSPKNHEQMQIDKMIFFAPAFMSNFANKAIRFISKLFPNLPTPVGSGDYNYNSYIKAKYYRPLSDASNVINRHGSSKANIPTLVLVKEHDKISKHEHLQEMIDNGLNQWDLFVIPKSSYHEKDRAKGHLITMREYVHASGWYRLKEKIRNFLE